MLDGEGNAASITCSNGTGSGVLPPGTGIHLNNMLGEEDLNPLGFHRHEPGTRVTSMMAPTVVLRDGEVELALGSAGSNRLRSAILQVIRHVVDDGTTSADAVQRGRLHYEAGILHAEPRLRRRPLSTSSSAAATGWFAGSDRTCSSAARRRSTATPRRGTLSGAGDPRRAGAVVVVD